MYKGLKGVYRKCENLNIFSINTLITNKKTVWEVQGAQKREDRAQLGGLGTNSKRVFYGKLTCTITPKILSVSKLTTKEHPYNVKKPSLQILIIFVV